MSLENAKAFAEKVAANPELLAKVNALSGTTIDALAEQVLQIAKSEGFECTTDEIKEVAKTHLGDLGEITLDDSELENVAGGQDGIVPPPPVPGAKPGQPRTTWPPVPFPEDPIITPSGPPGKPGDGTF